MDSDVMNVGVSVSSMWLVWVEPLVASLGMLLSGLFTIPLAGKLAGVKITMEQAFIMSVSFFVMRFVWLFFLRSMFSGAASCT